MKPPDLAVAADAGLREWSGAPDAIKSAAAAANLTYRIVDLHGGRVTVDSAGPGKGATFRMSLPVT